MIADAFRAYGIGSVGGLFPLPRCRILADPLDLWPALGEGLQPGPERITGPTFLASNFVIS